MSEHKPVICEQVPNTWHYSTRNHSCQYKCATCERTGRFNTNFLGSGRVVCDGLKFRRIPWRELIRCAQCDKIILSLADLALNGWRCVECEKKSKSPVLRITQE